MRTADFSAVLALPRETLALHLLAAILDNADVVQRARGRRAVLRISIDPEMLDVLAMFNSPAHEDAEIDDPAEEEHDNEPDYVVAPFTTADRAIIARAQARYRRKRP